MSFDVSLLDLKNFPVGVLVSLGIAFGDIELSPLAVMKCPSINAGKAGGTTSVLDICSQEITPAPSRTLTLQTTIKYVIIAPETTWGEGGASSALLYLTTGFRKD